MDTYQVIITPDAEEDLRELRDYIADMLLFLRPQKVISILQDMLKSND